MKKLIFLLFLSTFLSCGQKVSTSLDGTTVLTGKGNFGGNKDIISLKRHNDTVSIYYAYDALFKSISNKKAAVGISIRNDSARNLDGRMSALHVILRNDSLLVLHRKNFYDNLTKIFGKKNVNLPVYLKVVKNYDKVEVWSTRRKDGKYLTLQFQKDSVFRGWKYKIPNLIFPVSTQISSAEVASVKYTAISTVRDDTTVITPPDTTTIPPVVAFGEIPSISFPAPEMLNQVDYSSIGDFDIPKHADGRYKFMNLLVGPNFRAQSTAGNVMKKGFSMIDWSVMKVGTERQNPTYNPHSYDTSFVSSLTPSERTINITLASELYLNGYGSSGAAINSVDYSLYESYITGGVIGNISKFFDGSKNYTDVGVVFLDVEVAGLNDLSTQDYVNRIIALYRAIKRGAASESLVALHYQSIPHPHVGLGVTEASYTEPPNFLWTTPASLTSNAVEKNFPSELVGLRLQDLNYLLGVVEYYPYFEAFQPEGTILQNILNEPLKNWGGTNISVLTHFDTSLPSYLHFATHLNTALEINLKDIGNHKVLFQTSIFNQGGGGYYYADYGGSQPDFSKLKQSHDEYVYHIPDRIVEAMELNTLFLGAWYYPWMDGNLITPVSRSAGEIHNINERRRDFHGMTAVAAGMKRLSTLKTTIDGHEYSVADLVDGTEIYTRENTQVNYLNVSSFSGVKSVKGTDIQKHKLSTVRCIVNQAKGLIAILGYQPYGVEQSEVDVYYNNIFQYRIQIPVGENKVYIAKLKTS